MIMGVLVRTADANVKSELIIRLHVAELVLGKRRQRYRHGLVGKGRTVPRPYAGLAALRKLAQRLAVEPAPPLYRPLVDAVDGDEVRRRLGDDHIEIVCPLLCA